MSRKSFRNILSSASMDSDTTEHSSSDESLAAEGKSESSLPEPPKQSKLRTRPRHSTEASLASGSGLKRCTSNESPTTSKAQRQEDVKSSDGTFNERSLRKCTVTLTRVTDASKSSAPSIGVRKCKSEPKRLETKKREKSRSTVYKEISKNATNRNIRKPPGGGRKLPPLRLKIGKELKAMTREEALKTGIWKPKTMARKFPDRESLLKLPVTSWYVINGLKMVFAGYQKIPRHTLINNTQKEILSICQNSFQTFEKRRSRLTGTGLDSFVASFENCVVSKLHPSFVSPYYTMASALYHNREDPQFEEIYNSYCHRDVPDITPSQIEKLFNDRILGGDPGCSEENRKGLLLSHEDVQRVYRVLYNKNHIVHQHMMRLLEMPENYGIQNDWQILPTIRVWTGRLLIQDYKLTHFTDMSIVDKQNIISSNESEDEAYIMAEDLTMMTEEGRALVATEDIILRRAKGCPMHGAVQMIDNDGNLVAELIDKIESLIRKVEFCPVLKLSLRESKAK